MTFSQVTALLSLPRYHVHNVPFVIPFVKPPFDKKSTSSVMEKVLALAPVEVPALFRLHYKRLLQNIKCKICEYAEPVIA